MRGSQTAIVHSLFFLPGLCPIFFFGTHAFECTFTAVPEDKDHPRWSPLSLWRLVRPWYLPLEFFFFFRRGTVFVPILFLPPIVVVTVSAFLSSLFFPAHGDNTPRL